MAMPGAQSVRGRVPAGMFERGEAVRARFAEVDDNPLLAVVVAEHDARGVVPALVQDIAVAAEQVESDAAFATALEAEEAEEAAGLAEAGELAEQSSEARTSERQSTEPVG